MRRNWKQPCVVIAAAVAVLFVTTAVRAAVSPSEFSITLEPGQSQSMTNIESLLTQVLDLISQIEDLNDSVFKDKKKKKLLKDLKEIVKKLLKEMNKEKPKLKKIKKDIDKKIVKKVDGCSDENGEPDKNDVITDCSTQLVVRDQVELLSWSAECGGFSYAEISTSSPSPVTIGVQESVYLSAVGYFSDPDCSSEELTEVVYWVSSDSSVAEFKLDDPAGRLTGISPGVSQISVDLFGIVSNSIPFTVSEPNQPPVIVNLPATVQGHWRQSANSFDVDAVDPDIPADTLTWSLGPDSCTFDLTINSATGVLSWTCHGVESCIVNVRVIDAGDPNMWFEEVLAINCTNTPPVITSTPPTEVTENTTYVYNITCADMEGDPVALHKDTLDDTCPGSVVTDLENGTGIYTFTPDETMGGSSCTVSVICDDTQAWITQTTTVIINESNLQAHWKFDEGTGTTVSDSSGNGNMGYLMSITQEWIEGIVGEGALEFDGVNDYIEIPFSDVVFNARVFTVAMWLYHDSGDKTCALFRRVGGWHIRTQNYELDIRIEGGPIVRSGYIFPSQEWHHYAIAVDNINKTVAFYVDGQLYGVTHSYDNGFSDSTGDVYIGQFSKSFRWKGGMDDVRFYDVILDDSEVLKLFQMKN